MKVWWDDATLFVYFYILQYIHSFHHIHSVHSSVAIRRGFSPAPHRWTAQWENLPLKILEVNFLQILLVCLIRVRILVYLTRFLEILRVFRVNKRVRRGPIKMCCANFFIFHEMLQIFAQNHLWELTALKT